MQNQEYCLVTSVHVFSQELGDRPASHPGFPNAAFSHTHTHTRLRRNLSETSPQPTPKRKLSLRSQATRKDHPGGRRLTVTQGQPGGRCSKTCRSTVCRHGHRVRW
ncbi:hypothetical protein C0Q70_02184 [Pomacea canaliculata]|uniref:Uncharacterized protein n=1 Tax=Pomacea canaliculata TaxID=400727 RepID=A0A2T7Q1K9_POMCA|nr:hypothetical protein C0Q70_02184 [Pomacea canaliculata]